MYVTDFGNCGENDFIVYEMIYNNTLKKNNIKFKYLECDMRDLLYKKNNY